MNEGKLNERVSAVLTNGHAWQGPMRIGAHANLDVVYGMFFLCFTNFVGRTNTIYLGYV